VVSVACPTSHSKDPTATYHHDVAVIHEIIDPLIDNNKEIVVVAHSLGGISGCAAIEGRTVEECRAIGKEGGVKSIVFIAAFAIMNKGDNLVVTWKKEVDWIEVDAVRSFHLRATAFPVAFLPSYEHYRHVLTHHLQEGLCHATHKSIPYFYTGLSPEDAEYRFSQTKSQTLASFLEPVTKIPMTYLYTEKDEIVQPELQDRMIEVAGMKKVICQEGYFPMLT
jgi:pimeloyl-ACP methyl ester carboxylesterase